MIIIVVLAVADHPGRARQSMAHTLRRRVQVHV